MLTVVGIGSLELDRLGLKCRENNLEGIAGTRLYVGREDRSQIADEKLSSDVTSTQIKQVSNEHFETSATQSGVSMKEFGSTISNRLCDNRKCRNRVTWEWRWIGRSECSERGSV